jgi:hypothetical protein
MGLPAPAIAAVAIAAGLLAWAATTSRRGRLSRLQERRSDAVIRRARAAIRAAEEVTRDADRLMVEREDAPSPTEPDDAE